MDGFSLKLMAIFSLAWLSVFPVQASDTDSSAAQVEFHIIIATPNQCVALSRGQICYQDIILEWRSPQSGDYCVRSSQVSEPLHCWQHQSEGSMAMTVEAQESVLFTLHEQPGDNQLAEALMRVAWVYQQNRRKIASWRLF